jgi:hypothetical protein
MSQLPESVVHASFVGQVGIARVGITPPVGIYSRTWGAAKSDVAESIHRPLTLSVLVCSPMSGGRTLVFVDADLSWWQPLGVFIDFQKRLLTELSIDSADFIFGIAHTHAAPPLKVAEESMPGGELLNAWLEEIYQATVGTIREALAGQFEAMVDWHRGKCNLAAVRDLPDPGIAEPGTNSERIVCGYNPSEQADDTLLVGRVSDAAGKLRAVVVNYACHPTTLAWENAAISPDYLGAMRETIEQATGAVALFMQGASGELAPRHQYVGDTEVPDRHGRQLGFAALATLNDMEPPATELYYDRTVESGAPLAVWRHRERGMPQKLRSLLTTVELPLKNWPTAAELEQQRQACDDRTLEERLRRKRDIRLSLGDGESYALPVWTWRIGDAVVVGCCGEAYSILQRELRRRFPTNVILCMNLANGSIGYLPPDEKYDEDVYQAWQTPFDRGSLELLIEKMAETVGEVLGDEK